MSTIKKTLTIDSDADIQFNDQSRITLEQTLTDFFLNVPVNAFRVERVQEKTYEYEFQFIDGRVWHQHITYENPSDPLITFSDVHGSWREVSEVPFHRPVRSAVGAFLSKSNFIIRKISVAVERI